MSFDTYRWQSLHGATVDGIQSHISAVELLARIQAGDRVAAAEFVQRFGERIRCRVRAQMNKSVRRLFDSQDILSTVSRRLDELVCSGGIRASSEFQLLALLMKITNNAVVDKARVVRRLRSIESDDRVVARAFEHAFNAATAESPDGSWVIERAFKSTTDDVDRTILTMWLNGFEHAAIAATTRLSVEAVRFRWHRIRGRLREALAPSMEDAA